MARTRQATKGEDEACRTEEKEETAGGDPSYSGVIPPQGERSKRGDGQQADEFQWKVDVARGGDANEPGDAEKDEGHGRIYDSCGESGGTDFSLSWSAVYGKSW
jgi:hypothetical protein